MHISEIMKMHENFENRHGWNARIGDKFSKAFMDMIFREVVLMAGELGEFANKAKKMRREGEWTESDIAELREELTDIFMYLLKTAATLDMDIEKEYLEKLKRNEERFKRFEI